VVKVKAWEDTEYGRFWKKEANLRLQRLQYDKMTAMRQEGRTGELIPLDTSLWEFRPAETMDDSTATILDAHVAQLERELSILIYDIGELANEGRSTQARKLFVVFPQRIQEWEFFAQACLFAFPENHDVRIRMELSLLEAYHHLLIAFETYQTDLTKVSVDRWKRMIEPFTTGLTQILDQQETLTPTQRERLKIIKQKPTSIGGE